MDGNFTPFIDALPINTSAKAMLISEIGGLEGSILTASLFGNRDGTVESYEVNQFQSLLLDESQFLPSGTLTASGGVYLHLDGAAAASAVIDSITFANATGSDASTAAVGVTTEIDYSWTEPANSGGGQDNTLTFGTNLTGGNVNLGVLVGIVQVAVTTPAGTSITGTTGFGSVSVSNDPLGWGTSSLSGSYTPGTDSSVSASYGPAFPTGDVLVVGLPIAAAVAVGLLMWRRRRRRRAAAVPA